MDNKSPPHTSGRLDGRSPMRAILPLDVRLEGAVARLPGIVVSSRACPSTGGILKNGPTIVWGPFCEYVWASFEHGLTIFYFASTFPLYRRTGPTESQCHAAEAGQTARAPSFGTLGSSAQLLGTEHLSVPPESMVFAFVDRQHCTLGWSAQLLGTEYISMPPESMVFAFVDRQHCTLGWSAQLLGTEYISMPPEYMVFAFVDRQYGGAPSTSPPAAVVESVFVPADVVTARCGRPARERPMGQAVAKIL
ncbi:unnamed protein product [Prorocentrum cordatum]|uniref:Uncharacterized protein n=1 Tax=Prorocentrum cordatum TaxID=2364126 RepID=A0ABN9X4D3_9DINO|nr:unnamed protein product [Polarella glacialis]